MWWKGTLQYTVDENVNWGSHYGGFSQKTKNGIIISPSISMPGYIFGEKQKTNKQTKKPKKNPDLQRYMHLNVHSSIIYNCQDMEII